MIFEGRLANETLIFYPALHDIDVIFDKAKNTRLKKVGQYCRHVLAQILEG